MVLMNRPATGFNDHHELHQPAIRIQASTAGYGHHQFPGQQRQQALTVAASKASGFHKYMFACSEAFLDGLGTWEEDKC